MFNHAPLDYHCPICQAINGLENEYTLIKQSDIVYKDESVMAFISSFFKKNNPGHIVIVPTKHFENIYDLPEGDAHRIFDLAKKIALALKEAYNCQGVTTLQNNEPAGDQHAFHYHFHVFPRYPEDHLHEHIHEKTVPTPEERAQYANKLREKLKLCNL